MNQIKLSKKRAAKKVKRRGHVDHLKHLAYLKKIKDGKAKKTIKVKQNLQ